MNWCVSPAGTCPLPGPSQFFLPCLWGMGSGSSPSHIHPAQKSLSPPLPLQEAKEGEGVGGAGLPLGTAVAQSISPKPRKFLLPKRKKRKKNPSGHLSSLPHWDSQDWICGVPGRVAQGWNTLRQEWWSSLAGPPPGPLWASPLSPLLSPPSDPPEVAFPCPQALGLQAFTLGPSGGTAQPWRGWVVGPWLPPSIPYPLPSFLRAGHFLP